MSATETLPLTRAGGIDPYRLGRGRGPAGPGDGGIGRDHSTGHGEGGPASKNVIVSYGSGFFCSATS